MLLMQLFLMSGRCSGSEKKKGRSRSETMFSCPLGTALSLLSSELNLDLPLPLSHVGGDGDSFKLSLLKDGTFRFISLR